MNVCSNIYPLFVGHWNGRRRNVLTLDLIVSFYCARVNFDKSFSVKLDSYFLYNDTDASKLGLLLRQSIISGTPCWRERACLLIWTRRRFECLNSKVLFIHLLQLTNSVKKGITTGRSEILIRVHLPLERKKRPIWMMLHVIITVEEVLLTAPF